MKPPPEPQELFRERKFSGNNWIRKGKNRSYAPGASLSAIYKRDKGICWLCGDKVAKTQATRDHVKPFVDGGTNHRNNLKLAHRKCNQERADQKKGKK